MLPVVWCQRFVEQPSFSGPDRSRTIPIVNAPGVRPKVTVVIPSHNGLSLLPRCLATTVSECEALDATAAVLVVDNGSADGSIGYVRQTFPRVQVLALEENRGFADACDRGIVAAEGDYCFLLNNDAWLERGSLQRLLDAATRRDYAIAGPALLNPDGSLQSAPLTIDLFGHPTPLPGGCPPFLLVGAALLVRRADYLRVGAFDQRFFAFYEETDLQWRAHMYGLTVGYVPEARVYHIGGGTLTGATVRPGDVIELSWQRQYLARRNQLAALLMNYSVRSLLWVLPLWFLLLGLECLGMTATGHGPQVRAYGAAVLWNLRQLPPTLRRRRAIQARRQVSDGEVRRLFAPPLSRLRYLRQLAKAGTRVKMV